MNEDYSALQRLAVAQALYKVTAGVVSTKDPDSLRSLVDADVVANYETTGAKSYDVRMRDGSKVGTISVRVSKPKVKSIVSVSDPVAYADWAIGEGLGRYVVDEDAVIRHCELTGELPDGAEIVTREEPERVTGTTLKVDAPKVADALRASLPELAGLLEGGVE